MLESETIREEKTPELSLPRAPEAAEIVVGIPTCQNLETIALVVKAAQAGLRNSLAPYRSVLVHCDGGSEDGTIQAAREAATPEPYLLQITYPTLPQSLPARGLPCQGNAYREIFQAARKLGAKACVVLDSASASVRPEWIEQLSRPVVERDFDFVVPYYSRHKYDGTVTSGIVYPMVRALYGKRVRYPLGGDFAFSGRLVEHLLKQPVWNTELAGSGVDLWVTTQAVCDGFRACQAFLGAKLPPAAERGADVSGILAETLGALFTQMGKTVNFWQRTRASEALPLFGFRAEAGEEPAAVNVKRMTDAFRLGYETLQDIWRLVLPPATLLELRKLATHSDDVFRFGDEAWARTLYDFALGHRLRIIGRDHLLRAFTPLYWGWVASFIRETETASPAEVEARLETLCLVFEKQKPYFISRWRWPDRFNP